MCGNSGLATVSHWSKIYQSLLVKAPCDVTEWLLNTSAHEVFICLNKLTAWVINSEFMSGYVNFGKEYLNEVWTQAQNASAWQEHKTLVFLSDCALLHVEVCLFDVIIPLW